MKNRFEILKNVFFLVIFDASFESCIVLFCQYLLMNMFAQLN